MYRYSTRKNGNVTCTCIIFWHCRGARIAESQREEDMEMTNLFLIAPRGKECMVTLRRGGLMFPAQALRLER